MYFAVFPVIQVPKFSGASRRQRTKKSVLCGIFSFSQMLTNFTRRKNPNEYFLVRFTPWAFSNVLRLIPAASRVTSRSSPGWVRRSRTSPRARCCRPLPLPAPLTAAASTMYPATLPPTQTQQQQQQRKYAHLHTSFRTSQPPDSTRFQALKNAPRTFSPPPTSPQSNPTSPRPAPDFPLKHFLVLFLPIERKYTRGLRDDEFLVTTADKTPGAVAPARQAPG